MCGSRDVSCGWMVSAGSTHPASSGLLALSCDSFRGRTAGLVAATGKLRRPGWSRDPAGGGGISETPTSHVCGPGYPRRIFSTHSMLRAWASGSSIWSSQLYRHAGSPAKSINPTSSRFRHSRSGSRSSPLLVGPAERDRRDTRRTRSTRPVGPAARPGITRVRTVRVEPETHVSWLIESSNVDQCMSTGATLPRRCAAFR